jgi:hypothetical protein
MTTPPKQSELRALLAKIANDPDAGQWGEWARKLMRGNAARKTKAVARAKASTRATAPSPAGGRT